MQFENLIWKGVNHRRAQGYELARDKALEFLNATQRHQNLLNWNGQIKPVGGMITIFDRFPLSPSSSCFHIVVYDGDSEMYNHCRDAHVFPA